MKIQSMFVLLLATVALNAETVIVRQPGLVEAVGQAAVGTVQCVGEMAKGLVIGNTTVIQSNGVANTVIAAPATTVLQSPVVVSPAVPLMSYGVYYSGYYGYRHYYGGYGRPYWRSYRHGRFGCRASRGLCNAAAITGIVANSLQAVSAVTAPVAVANPVASVVVAQPPAVAVPTPAIATVHSPAGVVACNPVGAAPVANVVPGTVTPVVPAAYAGQQLFVSQPDPMGPAVVAPYGRAGRVVYYGY